MQKFYVLYMGDCTPRPVWAMSENDVRDSKRARHVLTVLTEDELLACQR